MKDSTKRLARLSVLTALGVILLLLANVLPGGRIGFFVIASFPVCAALLMYGPGWSAAVFAVTAALAFALFPGVTSIAYAAFFGYYPVLKSLFERVRRTWLGWVLKFALYSAVFVLYRFAVPVLFTPWTALRSPWLLYPVGAVVFAVYDWCYSLVIGFYIEKIARYFP